MLPKQNRLNKRGIERVFRNGRNFRGEFLILKTINQPKTFREKESISRFAVIVPVNVSKRAVERNKIKRLMRETLRKKLQELRHGFDGMFMALPGILGKNYLEIGEEIEKLLVKAEVLKT